MKASMDEKDAKIQELERKLEDMRSGQDIENIENMRRRALDGVILAGVKSTATTGDILKAVDEGGAGTYNVSKAPAQKLRVEIDGTAYYIGLYTV